MTAPLPFLSRILLKHVKDFVAETAGSDGPVAFDLQRFAVGPYKFENHYRFDKYIWVFTSVNYRYGILNFTAELLENNKSVGVFSSDDYDAEELVHLLEQNTGLLQI